MGLFKNEAEYREYLERKAASRRRDVERNFSTPIDGAPKLEVELHVDIMKHCDQQWPRWKYIHSRTDVPSTIQVGAQDFTIFLPGGRVLCIECKTATGKLSSEQLGWMREMELNDHVVHVVRSMGEFLEIVNTEAERQPLKEKAPADSQSIGALE